MGTGGIIFVAILALWGLYLVPVLVKERAARLDHRSGEASSSAVRVLHRPQAQRPSRRVVLTVDRPLVSDDLPALPTADLAETLGRDARRSRLGVQVRAGAALLGLAALLLTAVASAAGAFPVWSVALAGAWLSGVLASGAVAAAARRRATAAPVRISALPPRAHRVATEVFDNRAARPATARVDEVVRPAVGMADAVRPEDSEQTWTPVEVPGPVYASKPASHRPPALPWSMPASGVAVEPASVDLTAPQDAPAETAPAVVDLRDADEPAVVDLRDADELAEQRRSAAG